VQTLITENSHYQFVSTASIMFLVWLYTGGISTGRKIDLCKRIQTARGMVQIRESNKRHTLFESKLQISAMKKLALPHVFSLCVPLDGVLEVQLLMLS